MADHYSHVAFADESHYNHGRYRALGVVTLHRDYAREVEQGVKAILDHFDKDELKWNRIGSDSRTLRAVEQVFELVVQCAAQQRLRVDVLIWDIQDSRHNTPGRDDIENLHRMYHHLLKNVLTRRWPDEALWMLRLDESSVLKPDQIGYFLELMDSNFEERGHDLFHDQPKLYWRTYYRVAEIIPCTSHEHPLIQVADLFAGIACFSHTSYPSYCEWEQQNPAENRLPLFEDAENPSSTTRSQKARFHLLRHFNANCKKNKLGVSLKTEKGLTTKGPHQYINFWLYQPQGSYDKAPTRTGR